MLELQNDKQAKVSLDGLAQQVYNFSVDTLRKNLEVDGMEDEDAPIQEKDNRILESIRRHVVAVKKQGIKILKEQGHEELKKFLAKTSMEMRQMMLIHVQDARTSPMFKARPEQQAAHIKAYNKLAMINFADYVDSKVGARSLKLNELFEENETDIFFWARVFSQDTTDGWVPKYIVLNEKANLAKLYVMMKERARKPENLPERFVELAKNNLSAIVHNRIKYVARDMIVHNGDYKKFITTNIPEITKRTTERCELPLRKLYKSFQENKLGEE